MLGLKLNHVSKRGHRREPAITLIKFAQDTEYHMGELIASHTWKIMRMHISCFNNIAFKLYINIDRLFISVDEVNHIGANINLHICHQ